MAQVVRATRRARAPAARNPRLPFFGRISLTELALLAGAGWLFMSPDGRALLNGLGVTGHEIVGSGDSRGNQPDGCGPSSGNFNVVRLEFPFGISNGGEVTMNVVVRHIGAPGQYVVGVDLSPLTAGCFVGIHERPVQSFEADLTVGDDAVWSEYSTTVRGVYRGGSFLGASGPLALNPRAYVRSCSGNQMAELWNCGGLWVA